MEFERAKTPPILEWLNVSLCCSPNVSEDDEYPFTTLEAQLNSDESFVPIRNQNTFVVRRKNSEENEDEDGIHHDLHAICDSTLVHMHDIIKETEPKQNMLEMFIQMASIDNTLAENPDLRI